MISPRMAKIINCLPKGFVQLLSKKILFGYVKKYANIHIEGLDNLKNIKKPTIFVCNHLSNSDALILNKALKDIDPTFVAGVKLSHNSTTSLGINIVKTTPIKPNTADKEGIKKIINILKQGESVVIFPEATRSRTGSMIEGKKGIVLISKLSKAPIVPMGICGSEKLLPINKKGDMSSEEFHYADVTLKIGKQFEIPNKDKDEDKRFYQERAMNHIMSRIANLIPNEYRGVYSTEE